MLFTFATRTAMLGAMEIYVNTKVVSSLLRLLYHPTAGNVTSALFTVIHMKTEKAKLIEQFRSLAI